MRSFLALGALTFFGFLAFFTLAAFLDSFGEGSTFLAAFATA